MPAPSLELRHSSAPRGFPFGIELLRSVQRQCEMMPRQAVGVGFIAAGKPDGNAVVIGFQTRLCTESLDSGHISRPHAAKLAETVPALGRQGNVGSEIIVLNERLRMKQHTAVTA